MSEFKEDYRTTNPGLHALYLEWAVQHLALIDNSIKMFCDEANGNLSEAIMALTKCRADLVRDNAAYAQADRLITIYKAAKRNKHKQRQHAEIEAKIRDSGIIVNGEVVDNNN